MLATFRDWLDQQAQEQLPKSPVGKAVAYTRRHWDAPTRFVDDARLPLDNNLSERQLRSVAVGRANAQAKGGADDLDLERRGDLDVEHPTPAVHRAVGQVPFPAERRQRLVHRPPRGQHLTGVSLITNRLGLGPRVHRHLQEEGRSRGANGTGRGGSPRAYANAGEGPGCSVTKLKDLIRCCASRDRDALDRAIA
ncbi:MAG: transposase [Alphaproteobacteria bacterium]|nr:transposase [Alphaproteobacteria bacterium]